jgi:TRAP-type C4-dicarboxylate transport system permease large subunit
MYTANSISAAASRTSVTPIIPMAAALILVLLLVTYAPWLSLTLPRLIYGSL